ncbi:MAG: CHAT domain-containing protein [Cyanobacteria bacterium P01_F01_bin.150]
MTLVLSLFRTALVSISSILRSLPQSLRFLVWAMMGLLTALLLWVYPPSGISHAVDRPTPQTQPSSSAETLLQEGIAAFQANDFSQAIATWQQALPLAQTPENTLTRTLILSNLSLAHQYLGQWDTANQRLAESLAIFSRQDEETRSPTEWDYYGKTLNTQGWLQWRQGQQQDALVTWRQTTLAYQSANNIEGVIGSQLNQAKALQHLGLSSQAMDQIKVVQVLLDQQPDSLLKVNGLHHLGNALRRLGELDDSVQTLENAIAILQSDPPLDISVETRHNHHSGILLDLGNTHRAQWHRAMALNLRQDVADAHNASLENYQAASSTALTTVQSLQAQTNLLSMMIDRYQSESKQIDRAKLASRIVSKWQALHLEFEQLEPGRDSLELRLNAVNSLVSLKSTSLEANALFSDIPWSAMITDLQHVVYTARSTEDKWSESLALGYLGHIYESVSSLQNMQGKAPQWTDAKQLTDQAIVLAEQLQAPDLQYRWVWQLGRILQQDGGPANSVQCYQPGQEAQVLYKDDVLCAYDLAVQLLDTVRNDLLFINSDVQFSFRDNVEPLYREYVNLLLKDPASPAKKLRRAAELIDALQLAELENHLGCNVDPVPLSEQVVDPNAAIIYPVILDDRLEVIMALPTLSDNQDGQQFTRFSTPVRKADVDDLVHTLRQELADPTSRNSTRFNHAGQLYDWLIKPAKEQLDVSNTAAQLSHPIETLVFVLDGNLRNVPMAALWDNAHAQYLVEQYAIAIAPSLQLVDPTPMSQPIRALAAGTTAPLDHPFQDGKFVGLKYVEPELETISQLLPSEVLIEQKFTQANLKTKLQQGNFSIVHLATHGVFSSDPSRTFIAIPNGANQNDPSSDGQSDKTIDVLFADELNRLVRDRPINSRPVELLVLSACTTAQGDDRATLGIAGLSIRAGARSTLATLWSVYDEPAAKLMQSFYQQLAEQPTISRAKALQQAQNQIRQHQGLEHPSYWAPYIVVGNWL